MLHIFKRSSILLAFLFTTLFLSNASSTQNMFGIPFEDEKKEAAFHTYLFSQLQKPQEDTSHLHSSYPEPPTLEEMETHWAKMRAEFSKHYGQEGFEEKLEAHAQAALEKESEARIKMFGNLLNQVTDQLVPYAGATSLALPVSVAYWTNQWGLLNYISDDLITQVGTVVVGSIIASPFLYELLDPKKFHTNVDENFQINFGRIALFLTSTTAVFGTVLFGHLFLGGESIQSNTGSTSGAMM